METKTFTHAVIYNGVFYPANTPIKIKEEVKEEVKPRGRKKNDN